MLRFEMDVVAADMAERTIEGVIVPYGEVAGSTAPVPVPARLGPAGAGADAAARGP